MDSSQIRENRGGRGRDQRGAKAWYKGRKTLLPRGNDRERACEPRGSEAISGTFAKDKSRFRSAAGRNRTKQTGGFEVKCFGNGCFSPHFFRSCLSSPR